MRLFIFGFAFILFSICQAVGQNPTIPSIEKKKIETVLKDTIKKDLKKLDAKEQAKNEKFLKKLKKKLSFVSNAKEKEQKRINTIIEKYILDANLMSGIDIKKINDSLTKNRNIKIDSLGKVIDALNKDKENLSKKVVNQKDDLESLASKISESEEDLEMDKLVMNLMPMINEKAKEQEVKDQKEKRLKIIRNLINHPQGIKDTLVLSDSISKTFTLRLRKKEVVGFHPYWRNNEYYRSYNFSVLSSLIYYGYELDQKTGLCKDNHDWAKQRVTDFAKKENCRIYLGVFCEGEKGINELLKNNKTQETLINSIISTLAAKKSDGVNLNLGSPEGGSRLKLLKFIKLLNSKLIAANSEYKITLTIPVLDKNLFYDLKALEPMVEYFIIDFTKKNVKGPIVPISGTDYSLEAGISRYFGSNVPPEKFIACFPYHGAVWDSEFDSEFLNYITYSEIAESYTNDYGYKYDNGTERTDVVFNKVDTVEQLWFDDARTLSEKYDYVLNKNLSGVGIWALGDDNLKSELWETLLDKMIIIDTTDLQEIKTKVPNNKRNWPIWEKIKYEFHLYKLLFQHPCDFDQIDSNGINKRDEMVLDNYVSLIALFTFILLIVTGVYSVAKNRSLGDDWPKRKLFLSLLIVLTLLNMITILMYCFLHQQFKGFGAYDGNNCEVSLFALLKILGLGFLLGGFSWRLLVMPLIKRQDIP
jgi:hypothetical protein